MFDVCVCVCVCSECIKEITKYKRQCSARYTAEKNAYTV